MPSLNHAVAQTRIIGEFLKSAEEYDILSEFTLDLGGQESTPDISVCRKRKKDWLKDEIRGVEPPLLTVEILSPTQGSARVLANIARYFANGVKSCWYVNPPVKTVTVLAPDGGQETFTRGVVTDPATGLSADLAVVFAE